MPTQRGYGPKSAAQCGTVTAQPAAPCQVEVSALRWRSQTSPMGPSTHTVGLTTESAGLWLSSTGRVAVLETMEALTVANAGLVTGVQTVLSTGNQCAGTS